MGAQGSRLPSQVRGIESNMTQDEEMARTITNFFAFRLADCLFSRNLSYLSSSLHAFIASFVGQKVSRVCSDAGHQR